MQRRRFFPALFAANVFAVITLTAASGAATTFQSGTGAASDVRQRVAELRQRTQAHAAMARSRTQRERIAGEWWRRVALSPNRSQR